MFRLAAFRLSAGRIAAARPAAASIPRALTAVCAARRIEASPLSVRWYSAGGELSRDDIQKRIYQVLQDFDKVKQDKISPSADFVKDLGLDSLDTVEVVMAIEEEFSVEIPDEEADNIASVKDAIDYIAARSDAH
ncbi:mitochondrial acyl carrier protein [Coemansia nantahalensis]|uniref:Mitochondrial acyl carrier protein n=1 Tax=Coemansia nantahalensis TaxID=2789366 RepID=A0ACC1JM71_9FUNG|nr:mitochondrial acyl carrier protein [Coemansia nantahalensis]KAJ2774602.1 mitochondrial acyl carrier protein [Coemansia nantahalensis]